MEHHSFSHSKFVRNIVQEDPNLTTVLDDSVGYILITTWQVRTKRSNIVTFTWCSDWLMSITLN